MPIKTLLGRSENGIEIPWVLNYAFGGGVGTVGSNAQMHFSFLR
ncbi:hypothetical protein SAMN05421877_10313 [Sphingobacterium lactis]|uniref:Uncharacterized protein n=1 Tax=Sphingobacterium lactis TaxID=797291 RepID=A0A1H5V507_9SPHI|nr:hypothetical protein SAMN05421877_10313 [Sphingobacterium lactis]